MVCWEVQMKNTSGWWLLFLLLDFAFISHLWLSLLTSLSPCLSTTDSHISNWPQRSQQPDNTHLPQACATMGTHTGIHMEILLTFGEVWCYHIRISETMGLFTAFFHFLYQVGRPNICYVNIYHCCIFLMHFPLSSHA